MGKKQEKKLSTRVQRLKIAATLWVHGRHECRETNACHLQIRSSSCPLCGGCAGGMNAYGWDIFQKCSL
jgi:hypothetical protein